MENLCKSVSSTDSKSKEEDSQKTIELKSNYLSDLTSDDIVV